MYLEFCFKGDSRTFRITDKRELFRLKSDYEKYQQDPNSIKFGYYKCEVEGGERFQKKSVIFDDIDTIHIFNI
jgi:hypothetical protein